MLLSNRHTLALALAAVVNAVGLLDAIISVEWDFAAVFALSLSVHLLLLTRTHRGRQQVSVRPDLAHWLTKESGARGETSEDLIDRCIATYRAGLVGRD